ncbi:MarR family winged helix-turn-helix transcriptional regulator [Kitasatospora sp. LaBMicrA B282]|uniref:MarR family winged helix-turn-helix transcriptional regulator n=1 Tax=Kitasatospora sp. LaBMicrA B282 TaxID=3420949 RepID=UPI003D0F9DF4
MGKAEDGRPGVVPALVRTSFLVDSVYTAAARDHGITPQQGQLLCVLMAHPHGMGELGEVLHLARSSLTGLVDRTARLGLVARSTDARDARAVRVALTAPGSEVAAAFYLDTSRRVAALGADLAPAERARLAQLLWQVLAANEVPEVFLAPAAGGPAAVPDEGDTPTPG